MPAARAGGRVVSWGKGRRRRGLRWYNPKTRSSETVAPPRDDQDSERMLGGAVHSWAFVAEYGRLRREVMAAEQAMVFVGHRFRVWHLRHLPLGQRSLA
jgi:hypothetical protein